MVEPDGYKGHISPEPCNWFVQLYLIQVVKCNWIEVMFCYACVDYVSSFKLNILRGLSLNRLRQFYNLSIP